MKYTIEDIYEGLTVKNDGGKGGTYIVALYSSDDTRSKKEVHFVGPSYNNDKYPMENLLSGLNNGSYIEQPRKLNPKTGLPEKFFIKREPYNATIINKWFTENTAIPRGSSNAALYYPVYRGSDMKNAPKEGYVEVTFEQFKKAIGHEEINNSYSIF